MPAHSIIRWSPSGETERWSPTTLDQLGKYEDFLEDALAASPELLLLESRRTGVSGPFQLFRQVSMQTPSGRGITPDIVMLAASGHVIVVEVKRHVNPELKNRAVIAQIIDYASSFAVLTESECVELFGGGNDATWTETVDALFPGDNSPEELADVLLNRIQRGELNLLIACDKIPSGLPDVVSGIAAQSALGFELDLLEVVPYVLEVSETADILFVPSTRLSTEIVSRTAITVTYREGDAKPATNVETTSLEDIEANIQAANRRLNPDARTWTAEEVEEEFRASGHPVTLKLLEFVKQHSADGQFMAPGKKQNAILGFYVKGMCDDTPRRRMIFNCGASWSVVYIYLNYAESISADETMRVFRDKLKSVFGDEVNVDLKEVGVPYHTVNEHLEEFQNIMLWFQSEADAGLSE